MFSFEICKIFQNTFFTEHLCWLLLHGMKKTDFEGKLNWENTKHLPSSFNFNTNEPKDLFKIISTNFVPEVPGL